MSDIVERLREKSEWTNQRPYFHAHDKCIEAAAEITRLRAELTEAREGMDRIMIATAASVKASIDEYKRGHADGEKAGREKGLVEAACIARSAQYSKSPATDTMRGIEKLIAEPYVSPKPPIL